eukprot:m.49955 g.49955  ORF g.49955 m.49955 type:complete len:378 (+) comp17975_c0_seq2:121-1254(+)
MLLNCPHAIITGSGKRSHAGHARVLLWRRKCRREDRMSVLAVFFFPVLLSWCTRIALVLIFASFGSFCQGLSAWVEATFVAFGAANIADFCPIFSTLGLNKTMDARIQTFLDGRDNVIRGQIEEHRKTFDPDNIRDFCDHLLLLAQNDPKQAANFDTHGMIGALMPLFFAGVDTASTTLHWLIGFLADYPHFQKIAHAELDRVIGPDRLVTMEDEDNLPFVNSFLKEVMRLHPVAPLALPHMASADATLGGYDCPKDTLIFLNLYACARDPKLFDDPETFNPNRFADDPKLNVGKDGFYPFGAGHRVCLGWRLAVRELFLFGANLMHCFTFEDPSGKYNLTETELPGLSIHCADYEVRVLPRAASKTIPDVNVHQRE